MQNSYNLGFPGPFLPSHLGTLYESINAQSAAPSWSSPFTRNIPSPCRARRVMDGDTGPVWRQQDTLQAGICSELCLARYLQFSGTLKKTLVPLSHHCSHSWCLCRHLSSCAIPPWAQPGKSFHLYWQESLGVLLSAVPPLHLPEFMLAVPHGPESTHSPKSPFPG